MSGHGRWRSVRDVDRSSEGSHVSILKHAGKTGSRGGRHESQRLPAAESHSVRQVNDHRLGARRRNRDPRQVDPWRAAIKNRAVGRGHDLVRASDSALVQFVAPCHLAARETGATATSTSGRRKDAANLVCRTGLGNSRPQLRRDDPLGLLRLAGDQRLAGRREKIDANVVYELASWLFLGGVVGARAVYVLSHRDSIHSLGDVLQSWKGGNVFYGCILGGLTGSILYWLRRPFPFWAMTDVAAPAVAIGIAIGRIGCFLNGCCYGAVCDQPWAVCFPGRVARLDPPGRCGLAFAAGDDFAARSSHPALRVDCRIRVARPAAGPFSPTRAGRAR